MVTLQRKLLVPLTTVYFERVLLHLLCEADVDLKNGENVHHRATSASFLGIHAELMKVLQGCEFCSSIGECLYWSAVNSISDPRGRPGMSDFPTPV